MLNNAVIAEDPDLELAWRLAAEDVDALAELFERYGRYAYATALGILNDSGKAEDVVQEAFLRLWRNAPRFDPRCGSFRTWLLTTVRNRSVDYLRGRSARERQEREIPLDVQARDYGSDPFRELTVIHQREQIKQALATLPTAQRQTIELSYFGGYTQPEIARNNRVPLSTVKGRMRLGLKKLRLQLKERGFVYES